jgi:hypothetical protein
MFTIIRNGFEWYVDEEGRLYKARENDNPSVDDEDDDWEIAFDPDWDEDINETDYAGIYFILTEAAQ